MAALKFSVLRGVWSSLLQCLESSVKDFTEQYRQKPQKMLSVIHLNGCMAFAVEVFLCNIECFYIDF